MLPKSEHALYSSAVFGIAGPPLGAAAAGVGVGAFIPPFNFFVYLLGGPPAAVAGLAFAFISLLLLRVAPHVVIGPLLGLVIGFVAGIAGLLVWEGMFLGISVEWRLDYPAGSLSTLQAAVGAGCACGLLSGWLLPIGNASVANEAPRDEA